ncbi:unnamed protein product [Callosobruchus maculatus]|uniref:DPF1-3 N-terminal domain-containing protein n=1 Tax=Callosobruchus maculatus TaxID=64391 RepID=A0A653D5J3_CALMS|nr:unnamed protein product [Callosobruchus maculatus]
MATTIVASPSVPEVPEKPRTSLEKIESFLNDSTYKEILESSLNYNTRLCIERRLRLPFFDTQTGVAQNHSSLYMNKRQRIPGILSGQIYTYPRQRWRKKRRQYLTMSTRPFTRAVDLLDGVDGDMHSISQMENPALQDTDSKDSQLLKDEASKEWFYDEADMLEMDAYDEPDPDSDMDYEEDYRKRRKGKKASGRGRTDSPSTPGKRKGTGRGRKKAAGHSFEPTPGDPDKPYACERTPVRRSRQPGSAPSPGSVVPPPMGGPPIPTPTGVPLPSVGGPPTQAASGAPPTLPPNLPTQQPPQQQTLPLGGASAADDPPMPVLVPEKAIEPGVIPPGPALPMQVPPPEPLAGGPSVEGVEKKGPSNASPYCDFCLGDSKENKKTGTQEELVSCSDCGRSGKAAFQESGDGRGDTISGSTQRKM